MTKNNKLNMHEHQYESKDNFKYLLNHSIGIKKIVLFFVLLSHDPQQFLHSHPQNQEIHLWSFQQGWLRCESSHLPQRSTQKPSHSQHCPNVKNQVQPLFLPRQSHQELPGTGQDLHHALRSQQKHDQTTHPSTPQHNKQPINFNLKPLKKQTHSWTIIKILNIQSINLLSEKTVAFPYQTWNNLHVESFQATFLPVYWDTQVR